MLEASICASKNTATKNLPEEKYWTQDIPEAHRHVYTASELCLVLIKPVAAC